MGKKRETVQKTEIPEWLEAASQDAIGRAQSFADRPAAGFTPDQSTAFQQIRDFAAAPPSAAPAFELSADEAVSRYMNPYTEAALEPALRKIREQADRSRQQIGASAHMSGAYGDARHGVRENELDAITQQAVGDTSSKFLSDAFRQALGMEAQRGQFYEQGLGRQQSGLLQAINALLSSGSMQRDIPIDDELQRINAVIAAAGGVPSGRTTTKTQPDNSGWGALGSILGAFAAPFTGGASLGVVPAGIGLY